MKDIIPNWVIVTGGIGQMFTAIIYPYIRHKVFDWYRDIQQLKPLNQQIVKTYGRYIIGLNFTFGLITLLFTEDLKNRTSLAVALTGLIAIYWTGKLLTQFAHYPMFEIPNKLIFKIGEIGMNALFILFAAVYLYLFAFNVSGFVRI